MNRLCSLCNEISDDQKQIEGVRGTVGKITNRWVCAICRNNRLKYRAGV